MSWLILARKKADFNKAVLHLSITSKWSFCSENRFREFEFVTILLAGDLL